MWKPLFLACTFQGINFHSLIDYPSWLNIMKCDLELTCYDWDLIQAKIWPFPALPAPLWVCCERDPRLSALLIWTVQPVCQNSLLCYASRSTSAGILTQSIHQITSLSCCFLWINFPTKIIKLIPSCWLQILFSYSFQPAFCLYKQNILSCIIICSKSLHQTGRKFIPNRIRDICFKTVINTRIK